MSDRIDTAIPVDRRLVDMFAGKALRFPMELLRDCLKVNSEVSVSEILTAMEIAEAEFDAKCKEWGYYREDDAADVSPFV